MPSEIVSGQTTEGLPVAPSLGPSLSDARVPPERALVDGRVVYICVLSILIAGAAGFVAQALTRLIGLVTNLSFYGSVSTVCTSPAANRLGPLVILVPIAGAVVVIAQPGEGALAAYVLLGALVGVAAVTVTKVVYAIEDAFDRLSIHWMWWPAIGAVGVGVCGYFSPHTLGVGYDNIDRILSGDFAGQALLFLGALKFVSWSISLGSGTSGGTLAP